MTGAATTASRPTSGLYCPAGPAELQRAIAAGDLVAYAQSHLDAKALASLGFLSVTCGPANFWRSESAEKLRGARVCVISENNFAGHQYALKVCDDLRGVAREIKCVTITPDLEDGGAEDFLRAGHTAEDLQALIDQEQPLPNEAFRTRSTTENGRIVPVSKKPPRLIDLMISADELDRLDLPPLTFLVEDILPTGLCMLGAPAKTYKSFLALDLCLSICSGTPFLGHRTHKAGCLYLDLESGKRRPQARVRMIVGTEIGKPHNFTLITGEQGYARLGEGFTEQVEEVLTAHPDIKLVVVDVLQKIRPIRRRIQSGYESDYEELRELKQLVDQYDICLLLIHHTRKMRDETDVFNQLSGSVGILGSLDTAWVITREDRFSNDAELSITGRDLEAQQIGISFDDQAMRWKYRGTAAEAAKAAQERAYQNSQIVSAIKKLVDQGNGSWTGSASDLRAASLYFDRPIHEDPKQIGKIVQDFSYQLSLEGVHVSMQRTSQKRVFVFSRKG